MSPMAMLFVPGIGVAEDACRTDFIGVWDGQLSWMDRERAIAIDGRDAYE